MPTIDLNDVFSLGVDHAPGALWLRPEIPDIDALEEIAKGERAVREPIEYDFHSGRRNEDFLGASDACSRLISPKLIKVLEDAKFTGWSTFPVCFTREEEQTLLAGYQGLSITGRCGPIDDSLSEEVIMPPPVPEGQPWPALRGLLFEPDSWDGNDLFTPEGTTAVFITDQVKSAIDAAGITGVQIKPITEMVRDDMR